MDVFQTAVPEFSTGQAAIGTTAARLQTLKTRAYKGITIQASASNSGTIYVGTSAVTTASGFPLAAGASVKIEASDPSQVYSVASAAGQAAFTP